MRESVTTCRNSTRTSEVLNPRIGLIKEYYEFQKRIYGRLVGCSVMPVNLRRLSVHVEIGKVDVHNTRLVGSDY